MNQNAKELSASVSTQLLRNRLRLDQIGAAHSYSTMNQFGITLIFLMTTFSSFSRDYFVFKILY